MYSDSDLAKLINDGDKEAFTYLYHKYAGKILNHIHKMTGNKEISEEILGDVFITIIKKISFYKETQIKGHSFKSWIYRIATNLTIDYLRRKKKETQIKLNKVESIVSPDVEKVISSKEKLHNIDLILKKLPVIQRTIMNLKVNENMSYMEISRVTGVSISMVKQLLFKARTILKKELALMERPI